MNSKTGSFMPAQVDINTTNDSLLIGTPETQQKNVIEGLTKHFMKGFGDGLVPLGLEEGQACRSHGVLMPPVELQRAE